MIRLHRRPSSGLVPIDKRHLADGRDVVARRSLDRWKSVMSPQRPISLRICRRRANRHLKCRTFIETHDVVGRDRSNTVVARLPQVVASSVVAMVEEAFSAGCVSS